MDDGPINSALDRLAARDRVRRARVLALRPRERLDAMWRLIAESRETLERHPQGRQHFLRRNFRVRAIDRRAEPPCDDT